MKYQHLVSLALAAALLTGCGGTQSSPSAAADQSSDSSRSTPGAVAQAAQTDRITDQYTLEKNVSGVWGEEAVQCISVHVPQLECDSPDAAYINDELNAIYAADFREFENSEEAGQPDGEAPLIGVGWDDWWYGDCVSLVVRSRYGGTAPWRYSGWCFDFATGRQITTAEMLQRMGLDPDEVQQQVQRQAMQAFDREMAQGAYYEGLRLGGELSQMRMDTLEYNELENLCLLLPEQDQLVLRGKYSCEEGWQQLDMELSLPPADTPVLTDTYDGVQVQLEGTQATITLSPAPKTDQWGDIGIRVEQEHSYPILGAYNEYVDVCIANEEDAADVFGIHAEKTDIQGGKLDMNGYISVARQLTERFHFSKVAITLRGSLSASVNEWSGMLYSDGKAAFSTRYTIQIVDRVGGGDSFAGAMIYALANGYNDEDAVNFAAAASCLKHTIEHDFNFVSVEEVKALAGGNASGRVQR